MAAEYDIIVLGCGTMGAAVCLECARAGHRVLGLDRFNPPHDRGEHHGLVRMFRMSYYEHPAYVPWLKRSLRAWQDLRRPDESPIIELAGALYLGAETSELISGSLRSAREHGLVHEVLSRDDLNRRFPMFRLPRDFVGVLERDAGFIWCEWAVGAMLHAARVHGAEVRTSERVAGWECDNAGIRVDASTIFRSRKLVITAGPWSAEFLPQLGIPLVVTRQVQGWIAPPDPTAYVAGGLPCWAIDIGGGSLFYGFPALPAASGRAEIKLARHAHGPPADPDSVRRAPQQSDQDDLHSLVREYLPDLADTPLRTSVCLYTNSPDSHFLIDRHPRHPNVAFGAGFSGHGFKMAPAVGQILRGLVEADAPSHPEPFFAVSRLGAGRSGEGES
jgi:sarcosine oxidase